MTGLTSGIPDHNPDKDALIGYGLAVVGAFPLFGSVIADISAGMLAQRREARQHEFNMAVAVAVEELADTVDGLTPEAVVDSDEFLAAYERLSRVAAETKSGAKRARLAMVLGKMGPWTNIEGTKREQFLDLVARYDEIHIFLLKYFRNPVEWLRANAPRWDPNHYSMAAIGTILGEHVFSGVDDWKQTVEPILGQLKSDGLADVPMNTSMSGAGTVEPRTLARGNEFLSFVGE